MPDRNATLRRVASRAGTGVGTASRVFSGNGYVSEKARGAVLEAARELGYSVHPTARALATGRSHVIALWARGVFRPFFSAVAGRMQQQTARSHYHLLIDEISQLEDTGEATCGPWPVDGIVSLSAPALVETYLQTPKPAQRPLVNMGHFCHRGVDFVQLDLRPAAQEAMRHLLQSGRRRVVYITGEESSITGPRAQAYNTAMAEAGLPTASLAVPAFLLPDARRRAREVIAAWLDEHDLPEAFFCYNDDIALGAYRALRDIGARVPDDVALVGADGIEDADFIDAPLSTIVTPFEEMCATAWQFLLNRINDPLLPLQSATLRPRFQARASSQGSLNPRA